MLELETYLDGGPYTDIVRWLTTRPASFFKKYDKDHGGSLDVRELEAAVRAYHEQVVWPAEDGEEPMSGRLTGRSEQSTARSNNSGGARGALLRSLDR